MATNHNNNPNQRSFTHRRIQLSAPPGSNPRKNIPPQNNGFFNNLIAFARNNPTITFSIIAAIAGLLTGFFLNKGKFLPQKTSMPAVIKQNNSDSLMRSEQSSFSKPTDLSNAKDSAENSGHSTSISDVSDGSEEYAKTKIEAKLANSRYARAWRMVPANIRWELQQSIANLPQKLDAKCKKMAADFPDGYHRKNAYLKCSLTGENTLSNGIEQFAEAYRTTNGKALFRDFVKESDVLSQ